MPDPATSPGTGRDDETDQWEGEGSPNSDTAGRSGSSERKDDQEVPEPIVEEVVRFTRRARETADPEERDALFDAREQVLGPYDFEVRVREETHDVLVLYPSEWVEDGTVVMDAVEDVERGIERPLEGVGATDDWDVIHAHNSDLATEVATNHGADHGANAQALADFMSNHYLKPVEDATRAELREFLTEYYPRNVWPTDDQQAVVRESVQLVFECAGEPSPL